MSRKKKIMLAAIVLIWLAIGIILANRKGEAPLTTVTGPDSRPKAGQPAIAVKTGEYPALSLAVSRPDLFSQLYNAAAEKKELAGRKKVLTIAAPPMPILPGDVEQKKEEAADLLKDVSLLGIVEKNDKKMSFFRKNKDIKSYSVGERIFETPYLLESIESGRVLLKGPDGDRKSLDITKEKEKEVKK